MPGGPIIREKSCAAGCPMPPQAERIRRFDSRCSSQLRGRRAADHAKFLAPDTATLREKCFIAPASRCSGTVGTTKTSSKVSADVTNSLRPYIHSLKSGSTREETGDVLD